MPVPSPDDELAFENAIGKLVTLIRRKASFKQINGKAVNGSMFIALALEYAETLSQ